MIPETIGRYEVQCLLGEGAFGQVYAARDPVLSRAVAIKVLREIYSADASFMERFRAEATSLAALTHHNITPIYDLLQSGAQHGMIMELVRGHTLEHVLRLKPRLTVRETQAIVAQAVSGLGYVHRQDVVHRDIKPSNIMMTAAGVLKIMDFGIARVQGAKRLTRDGSVLGTLAYAAPEQIKNGEGEPGSDQYSLACVVYEMLCGRLPFEATTEYELMQAHIARPPEPCSAHVAGIPEEVERSLMRALAKSPAERFETVEEFGRALGVDAVQLQAVDIVRDIVGSSDPIPAIPQRVSSGARRPSAEAPPTPVAPPVEMRPSAIRRHSPMMVMGAAAVAAVGVAAFIFFDSRLPVTIALQSAQADTREVTAPAAPVPAAPAPPVVRPEPKPAIPDSQQVEKLVPPPPDPPPPPALKPAEILPQLQPEVVRPRQAERPGADTPEAGKPRAAIVPEAENARLPEKPVPRPAENPPEKQAEKPAEKPTELAMMEKPKPPEEKPKPPEVTMPGGSPNYQGRVVAWLSGSTIMVRSATGGGFERLRLFGIRDKQISSQKEADIARDQLETFLAKNGHEATCFTRYSTEFKEARALCFIDKKDMALWAIESNLGRASGDAPPNYPKTTR